MPRITSIRRNVKNASRCSVYVDDAFFAACPIDVALALGLAKGMEMTSHLEQTLRSEDRRMVLRQKLYRFATYKPRTEQQVVQHLEKLEAQPEEINDICSWLREFHLVDDGLYAQRFLEAAHHQKPLSPADARRRLRSKGISDDVIAMALSSIDQQQWANHTVRVVAEKKLRTLKGTPAEQQRKLIHFLQYRGFSWDVIRTVVQDLLPCMLWLAALLLLPKGLSAQENDCQKQRLSESVNRFQPTTLPLVGPDDRLYVDRKLHPDNSGGITDPDDVWTASRRSPTMWNDLERRRLTVSDLAQPDVLFNFTPDGLHAMVVGPYDSSAGAPRAAFAVLHRRSMSDLFSSAQILPVPVTGPNYFAFLTANREACFIAQNNDSALWLDLRIIPVQSQSISASVPIIPLPLNTDGMEGAPWLAADGRTLFFASNGRADRRGKSDLYMSRRVRDDWHEWSEPRSLGWCVNSQEDEVAISLLAGDSSALITSWDDVVDRPGIYQVQLPDSVRPLPYLVLDVVAVNDVTDEVLPDVTITANELQWYSDTTLRRIRATFGTRPVPYVLHVAATGFDTTVRTVEIQHLQQTVWYLDTVRLFPSQIPVASVYFDRGSDAVSATGRHVLTQLLQTLHDRSAISNIRLEIDGFTDAIGSQQTNIDLAVRRARSVARLMRELGFSEDQCTVAGRGIDRSRRIVDPEGRRVDIYARRR